MIEPTMAVARVRETRVLLSTHVSRYALNAKVENTRKAYRIDWDDFVVWCDLHGQQQMPAAPETIVSYLKSLADAWAKFATIERRLSLISLAHEICGHGGDNPARSTIACS